MKFHVLPLSIGRYSVHCSPLVDSRLSYAHASDLAGPCDRRMTKKGVTLGLHHSPTYNRWAADFAAPLLAGYSIAGHTFIVPQGIEGVRLSMHIASYSVNISLLLIVRLCGLARFPHNSLGNK